MRTLSRIALVAISAVGPSGQALAAWNFTEWGMTPDQVVAASSGSVSLLNPPESEGRIRAQGEILSGDLSLIVRFGFGIRGLNAVHIKPASNGFCDAFMRALYGKYSNELRMVPARSPVDWDVPEANMHIRLVYLGGACGATYTPLKTADSDGL